MLLSHSSQVATEARQDIGAKASGRTCLRWISQWLAVPPNQSAKLPARYRGRGMGWMTGFEPATSGSTIRRSNQLSYTHHGGDDDPVIGRRVILAK